MVYKRIEITDEHSTCEYLAVYDPLPWQKLGLQYSASGYGRKIPTEWTVYYKGRDRRIYVCIYSNVGTSYIIDGGNWRIVDSI